MMTQPKLQADVKAARTTTKSSKPSKPSSLAEVPWVGALASRLAPDGVLSGRRGESLQRFRTLGLPTPRHEQWRWFPVGHLSKPAFEQAAQPTVVDAAALSAAVIAELQGPRLVFVYGHLAPQFIRNGDTGLTLESLVASNGCCGQAGDLANTATGADQAFVALNNAFYRDGARVRVSRKYVDDAPVHLLFVSTRADGPRVNHPRVVIEVEAGAQVHVVQEHIGWATQECLTNVVTEAHVAAGGRLYYTKLTHESASTTHVAALAVHQERDSFVQTHSFSWGGGHVRNDVDLQLAAEGASCELHGLIYLKGKQVADDHTRIHHLKPHTTSVERYRAVLDGESRGAFAGAIYVAADAQQVNSQQSSRNLLLSGRALMNTKPELQILADDVKCSHGATIGQLDPAALFYLRSRGIDKQAAVRMLTLAFGRAVVDRMPLEVVRQGLTRQLFGESSDVD
jgi:Fe-S cluster assembly protein SufD